MDILNDILSLTRQLYPTGRVFNLPMGSVYRKLHEGLAESEKTIHAEILCLLNAVLPDNANFTEADATRWESALGLVVSAGTSLADRKSAILRKLNHPGNIPARQHYLYLEGQLQAAGFDVYVYENKFSGEVIQPFGCVCGLVNCGTTNVGTEWLTEKSMQVIANHIVSDLDFGFNIGGFLELRNSFFIGGSVWPSETYVAPERMHEFRDLVLKIKPAQSIGILLQNNSILDETGDAILDESSFEILVEYY